MLMNIWQFHLMNWQGVGPMLAIFISFFTLHYLSEHFHSHTGLIFLIANSPLLLAFCFLLVCMVDQTQMCPSCISPLGLFQRIM